MVNLSLFYEFLHRKAGPSSPPGVAAQGIGEFGARLVPPRFQKGIDKNEPMLYILKE
jgi:hypothetical protein